MKNTPQNNQTKLFKILIIFASVLVAGLFIVGIVQTFVHKNLLKKQSQLDSQETQLDSELEEREKDLDFLDIEEGEVIIKH